MASLNLSKRSELLHNWEDFLMKYLILCCSDEYHPEQNKNGYINIGTAVNNLCNDILHPKIISHDIWSCDTNCLQYMECYGIECIREAFAAMMTIFLESHEPIKPENLFFSVGVTGSLDVIAHCLADPGDVILTPTPVYGRIYTDFMQRALVHMWPIPIFTKDCKEQQPVLTLAKIEEAYLDAKHQGRNVRAVLILNPSNPLGDVYDSELLMSILQFCHKNSLHVVIDEVYALSVFDENTQFHSVLSFPDLPDPYNTHVLYGLSKDFALAGLRIGITHTLNKTLQNCLIQLSPFQTIPYPIMTIAARLVKDIEFCKNFVSTNQKRLREKFNFCKKFLEDIGIPVRNSTAGFFLWVSLKEKCGITNFEEEKAFFLYMIQSCHLYIVPGKELFCAQPGWFRISFTGKPDHVIAGLHRLKDAVNNYKKDVRIQLGAPKCDANLEDSKLRIDSAPSGSRKPPERCSNENVEVSSSDDNSLESLVALLRTQIIESDWLSSHSQTSKETNASK